MAGKEEAARVRASLRARGYTNALQLALMTGLSPVTILADMRNDLLVPAKKYRGEYWFTEREVQAYLEIRPRIPANRRRWDSIRDLVLVHGYVRVSEATGVKEESLKRQMRRHKVKPPTLEELCQRRRGSVVREPQQEPGPAEGRDTPSSDSSPTC